MDYIEKDSGNTTPDNLKKSVDEFEIQQAKKDKFLKKQEKKFAKLQKKQVKYDFIKWKKTIKKQLKKSPGGQPVPIEDLKKQVLTTLLNDIEKDLSQVFDITIKEQNKFFSIVDGKVHALPKKEKKAPKEKKDPKNSKIKEKKEKKVKKVVKSE
ncbi:hypothetical protein DLAC_11639 [Tieghemostelium lacteum]|uniref:Uncharacterized protein n=1 Tax=Tieghemostelium lacteum TaxID=361077 RepID=A0A151ZH17_TIELA|nr:hypothetical protein DLAC_11639 [Tieghemostelium lacteum]|eukprot:KYQ93154.1 hypothetical protein DLAC_11639 [Tieghemostelium lacteum]